MGLASQPMEISHNIQRDEAKSDIWTLGSEMRSIRISRGLTLEDVADRLKIKASVLSALEEGQEDLLPGRIYTLGFIRAYAEFLGLDGAEAVARYKREHDISIQPVELNFPVPPPSSGLPKKWIMLMAVGAAVAIFAGWQTYDRSRQISVETVTAPPVADSASQQLAQASSQAGQTAAERVEAPINNGGGQTGNAAASDTPSVLVQGDSKIQSTDNVAANEVITAPLPGDGEDGGNTGSSARTVQDIAQESVKVAKPPSQTPPAATPAATDDTVDVAAAQNKSVIQSKPSTQMVKAAQDPAVGVVSSAMAAPSAAAREGDMVNRGAASPATAASVARTQPDEDMLPPPALPERMPANLTMANAGSEGQILGDKGGRIVIRARQESWVQVTSPDRTLLTRVLRPGDEFHVPDMKGLRLDTGNAGGLELWVDGQRIPPLAPIGNAMSGVALSPAELLARR